MWEQFCDGSSNAKQGNSQGNGLNGFQNWALIRQTANTQKDKILIDILYFEQLVNKMKMINVVQ